MAVTVAVAELGSRESAFVGESEVRAGGDPFRLDGIRRLVASESPPRADEGDHIQRFLFALLGYVRQPLTEPLPPGVVSGAAVMCVRLDILADRLRRLVFE